MSTLAGTAFDKPELAGWHNTDQPLAVGADAGQEDLLALEPTPEPESETAAAPPPPQSTCARVCWGVPLGKHYFLIGMLCSALIAFLAPEAGAKKGAFKQEVTSSWIAVWIIFVISGWSLKTRELVNAIKYMKLNLAVQGFNLGVIPFGVYGIVEFLRSATSIDDALLTGLVISTCLPTTVSMCVMLVGQSDGNEAAAVFNAASGNVLGVFVTPVLILLLVGNESNIPFLEVLAKLALKVLLPLAVGQCIQYFIKGAREYFVDKPNKGLRKKKFIRCRETAMIWICYTTFCETFHKGITIDTGSFLVMFAIVALVYLVALVLVSVLGSLSALGFTRPDRITLLFCGTHKTVAMGIPLMNTIFDDNPKLGIFVIPLLIYHPLQLVIGSLASSRLADWVAAGVTVTEEPEDKASQAVP